MHTRQKSFLAFFSKEKAPAGKFTHGKKVLLIFSGNGIFMYYVFSHLRTKYLIRKSTYFSYTFFSLEHNRIFSYHNRVFSEHNRIFSHHNRVFSHHNRVFSHHNRVFSNHNRIFSHHNRILSHQNRIFSEQNEVFLEHTRIFSDHLRAQESKNTRKMVGSYITWLLYG